MDDWNPFRSMSIGHPIPEINLFQTLTLKLQGQGHGCGQRAMSYRWLSNILTHFLFISHQSDQQFLKYSYFEIWPWNIQGQGHEWGQRSRSHIMRFHFIMQTSKFLLINATAVTLGGGHRKVIRYISPDPYILCAKYLWFSFHGFDVRGKSCCDGGRGRGRNKLKT